MVNLQKSGDSAVKFVFTDSDHYLYGNGEIEVPVNSLLLVIDESDMVTFKKLSGDPFLSFRADNSNLGTKAAIEQFYKDNMVGSTGGGSGSGVTPSEVQEMIDESISGKADTSDVTAVANDVSTLSGQVATKVDASDFNAYSAATDSRLAEDEEVTAAALNDLDERIGDPYQKVSGLTIETDEEEDFPFIRIEKEFEDGNSNYTYINDAALESTFDNNSDGSHYSSYVGQGSIGNDATDSPDENVISERHFDITTDGFRQYTFENYEDGESQYTRYQSDNEFEYTNGLILSQQWYDEKNDTTTNSNINIINNRDAETYIELTDGENSVKIETTGVTINGENVLTDGIITTAITSGSTDDEIPTAKAVYDAIPTGGTSVTVDPTLDSGSTNPVANSAITTAMNAKADKTGCLGIAQISYQSGYKSTLTTYNAVGSGGSTKGYFGGINGSPIAVQYSNQAKDFQLVEKSAITSAMTSSSTDAQVPSAKAVYDTLGGLKFVKLTQSEYDQLATKDPDTLYIISNIVS